jgi:hypothetical protein
MCIYNTGTTQPRMRSKSINVHAMVDEAEDSLDTLEAYFNTTVINLTETGDVTSIGRPSEVISPFAHHTDPSNTLSLSSSDAIPSVFTPSTATDTLIPLVYTSSSSDAIDPSVYTSSKSTEEPQDSFTLPIASDTSFISTTPPSIYLGTEDINLPGNLDCRDNGPENV